MITTTLEWTSDAACQAHETELFFPPIDTRYRPGPITAKHAAVYAAAIAICRDCPVIDECRAYVMESEPQSQRHGVWAGLTPTEREKLYKRMPRRIAPPPPPGHGTDAGYKAHQRNFTTPCEGCLEAHAAANKLKRERVS